MSSTCSRVDFFFQAEAGIRDLGRSRGLGDVSKGQVIQCPSHGEVHYRCGGGGNTQHHSWIAADNGTTMTGGAAKVGHRHSIGQCQRVALGNNRPATGDIAHPGNGFTFHKTAGASCTAGGTPVTISRPHLHVADPGANPMSHRQLTFP